MKDKYVVEVINNCCFQHGTPEIIKRFSNKSDALAYVYDIKNMTIKETEKLKTADRYIDGIRILDTTNYPPQTIYEVEMVGFIPEYQESDKPQWDKVEYK